MRVVPANRNVYTCLVSPRDHLYPRKGRSGVGYGQTYLQTRPKGHLLTSHGYTVGSNTDLSHVLSVRFTITIAAYGHTVLKYDEVILAGDLIYPTPSRRAKGATRGILTGTEIPEYTVTTT